MRQQTAKRREGLNAETGERSLSKFLFVRGQRERKHAKGLEVHTEVTKVFRKEAGIGNRSSGQLLYFLDGLCDLGVNLLNCFAYRLTLY